MQKVSKPPKNGWAKKLPFVSLSNHKDEEQFVPDLEGSRQHKPISWGVEEIIQTTRRKLKTLDANLV